MEMILGISERINVRKAEMFASASIISMAALGWELEWKLFWPLELPSIVGYGVR